MNLVLRRMFRGMVFLLGCVTVVSVGLGQLAPPETHYRLRRSFGFVSVDGFRLSSFEHAPRFIDPETGRLVQIELPREDYFDHAACSPWQDEKGELEIVGRWATRPAPGRLYEDYGLARYTYPSGRVLERISLECGPMSPPCFDPAMADRILFTDGAGRLLRMVFRTQPDVSTAGSPESTRPRLVAWQTPFPDATKIRVSEPIWPVDPRLNGRLLAVFQRVDWVDGAPVVKRSQIHWLELNPARTEIVASGPVIAPLSGPADNGEEARMPNLAIAPDGRMVFAYVVRQDHEKDWRLRLAPVELDSNGIPSVKRERLRTVARFEQPTLPAFSADGRWVYTFSQARLSSAGTERFSVLEALAGRSPRPTGLAFRGVRLGWQ